MVHGSADDHHRAALSLVGVVSKLSCNSYDLLTGYASDRLLPGWCIGGVGVVVFGATAQPPVDAILGNLQVEHGGDHDVLGIHALAQAHFDRRDLGAVDLPRCVVGGEVWRGRSSKIRKTDFDNLMSLLAVFHHGKLELDVVACARVFGLEVPLALIGAALWTPAEPNRSIGQHYLTGRIERHGLPLGIVLLTNLVLEIAGAHITIGHHRDRTVGKLLFLEHDEQRQIGIATGIVVKIGTAGLAFAREVKLFEHHMTHGHGHRSVGALLGMHPDVGKLGHLGVVRCHRNRLGALVTDLGKEVSIRRACLGHVGAPGDDVVAVVPVSGLRHIGLFAPDLRAGRRQVAVPVVKAHAHTTNQRQVAATGRVADHRHGGDGRKADHAVRTVFFDRVDIGAGDQLVDLVPAAAHEPPHAPDLLIVLAGLWVLGNQRPGIHGGLRHFQRSAPALQQATTDHWVFDAVGAVQIPGI